MDAMKTVLRMKTNNRTSPNRWAQCETDLPESLSIHKGDRCQVSAELNDVGLTVADVFISRADRTRYVLFTDVTEDYLETIVTRTKEWQEIGPFSHPNDKD